MTDAIGGNKRCICCKLLNQEKEDIEISEIYIRPAGHYNFSARIRHCPECGRKLKKYARECSDAE